MCGIAGKYYFEGGRSVSPALIRSMNASMIHRGPDGEGIYTKGPVGLGHRRLSIIDVDGGKQPLTNEDGTVWIVFNGEIYNYLELRKSLIRCGHRFQTESDTEVIVHAYEEYGEDCVTRLRGMFAFAVWDERSETLFVARDRLGIKPVYYAHENGALTFASEVKALLADPEIERGVEPLGIARFLAHYYTAGTETPFRCVRKLEPGHCATVRRTGVTIRPYWDLDFSTRSGIDKLDDAAEELESRLQECVKLHLISDVPLGVLLSGGMDSTALLSVVSEETSDVVRSFTVGFDDPTIPDERPFARMAADKFGAVHREMSVTPADFADALAGYVWHMEEPVCEPPAVSLFFVSRLASEHVKVLISGEGGDEAFAGYPQYKAIPLLEQYRPIARLLRRLLVGAAPRFDSRVDHYLTLTDYPFEKYYLSRSSTPLTWFNTRGGGYLEDVVGPLHERSREWDTLSRMLYADTKTWLPDDLLVKADKMTMANSVELRVPFLDHEIIEFAASLPSSLKVRRGDTKRVLKRAFRKRVPQAIQKRRKAGFPIPYVRWMREDLFGFVHETLLSRKALDRGFYPRDQVDGLLREFRAGRDHSKTVFSLLVLELWHNTFIDHDGKIPQRTPFDSREPTLPSSALH